MRGMDAKTGTWLEGTEHLVQSIRLILATPINTRVMLPEFGSDVPNLISAPMTAANRLRLYAAATEAITRWEPRITVKKVEVTGEGANGEIDLVIEGTYDGESVSIPIIDVGVVMRSESFWIKDLTIVLPAGTDKIPVSKLQEDGTYGPDAAVTLTSLLALASGGGSNFSISALDSLAPDETLTLQDLIAIADNSNSDALKKVSVAALMVLASTLFPEKIELEGHEEDSYLFYEENMLQTGTTDKREAFIFTTDSSGPPTDGNKVNALSDINDGNYIFAVSPNVSADADPNQYPATAKTLTAADFPANKVIYLHSQIPYDTQNYIKMTTTAAGVAVGTGNSAYIWMPVAVDEIETFANGDWMRLSELEPTDFFRKMAERLRAALQITGDPTITQTTQILLDTFQSVSFGHAGRHIIPETTAPIDIPVTWEDTPETIKNGNNLIGIQNALSNGIIQIVWSLPNNVTDGIGDTVKAADIEDSFNLHHLFKVEDADGNYIKGKITSFNKVSTVDATFHQVNLQGATQHGSFTDGESVNVKIQSNLISRDEFDEVKEDTDELGGWTPLMTNTSTAFSGKQWRQIDLGNGNSLADYRWIVCAYHYNPNSNAQRGGEHRIEVKAVQDLGVNATSGTNWWANGQRGIEKSDAEMGKFVVGKRANDRYIAIALDRHDTETTTITLSIRGYK